jgi:hypothetical protein
MGPMMILEKGINGGRHHNVVGEGSASIEVRFNHIIYERGIVNLIRTGLLVESLAFSSLL